MFLLQNEEAFIPLSFLRLAYALNSAIFPDYGFMCADDRSTMKVRSAGGSERVLFPGLQS